MTRKELQAKLEKGERLTPLEMAFLDTFLEEDTNVVRCVQNLTREEPSLEWRAKLNERLLQLSSKKNKPFHRSFSWMIISTSLATACILLFIVLSNRNTPLQNELGKALLEWHEEAVASSILPDGVTQPNAYENISNNTKQEDDIEELLYGSSNLEL
ncbi:MAG TPA: hypothetical protein VNK96_00665 [Fimbriimonadales bacterium]|nr:hypothetical protein [Fimbriimonadales bacterium]